MASNSNSYWKTYRRVRSNVKGLLAYIYDTVCMTLHSVESEHSEMSNGHFVSSNEYVPRVSADISSGGCSSGTLTNYPNMSENTFDSHIHSEPAVMDD
jgi:hypothetical protein